jgi:hypothetical protein
MGQRFFSCETKERNGNYQVDGQKTMRLQRPALRENSKKKPDSKSTSVRVSAEVC